MKTKIIHATHAAEQRDRDNYQDGFNSNKLSIDQISQLIEQTAPYANFLVLADQMRFAMIKALEKQGHYVNTIQDLHSKEWYTLIKWPEI